MGQTKNQVSEKKWIKDMVTKFIAWREKSGYGGAINTYEVARFTQQIIAEVKEIYEKKLSDK